MKAVAALVALAFTLASAGEIQQRAPLQTTIQQYPSVVAVLRSANLETYSVHCAGTILNNRSIVTTALCVDYIAANRLRFRVGSETGTSGGEVYNVAEVIIHYNWDEWAMGTDLAILRSASNIGYDNNVQPGTFAGANYNLADNQVVGTAGWGYLNFPVWNSAEYEQLRQIQLRIVDVTTCREYYATEGFWVPTSQICTGADSATTSRDKCFGGPGTPLYHGSVVVGIRSYALNCNSNANFPSISTRVSSFIDWLVDNA